MADPVSTAAEDSPRWPSWRFMLFFLGMVFLTALFAFANLVLIPEEKQVLTQGREATATIVRLWLHEYRDAKGNQRRDPYVHLAWRTEGGEPREYSQLSLAMDTYTALKAQQDQGSKTTLIRYDPSGKIPAPMLLADLAHREREWMIARWMLWIFGAATIASAGYIVHVRRSAR